MNKTNTVIESMTDNEIREVFNEITAWRQTGELEEGSLLDSIYKQRIIKHESPLGSGKLKETANDIMYEATKRYVDMMFE